MPWSELGSVLLGGLSMWGVAIFVQRGPPFAWSPWMWWAALSFFCAVSPVVVSKTSPAPEGLPLPPASERLAEACLRATKHLLAVAIGFPLLWLFGVVILVAAHLWTGEPLELLSQDKLAALTPAALTIAAMTLPVTIASDRNLDGIFVWSIVSSAVMVPSGVPAWTTTLPACALLTALALYTRYRGPWTLDLTPPPHLFDPVRQEVRVARPILTPWDAILCGIWTMRPTLVGGLIMSSAITTALVLVEATLMGTLATAVVMLTILFGVAMVPVWGLLFAAQNGVGRMAGVFPKSTEGGTPFPMLPTSSRLLVLSTLPAPTIAGTMLGALGVWFTGWSIFGILFSVPFFFTAVVACHLHSQRWVNGAAVLTAVAMLAMAYPSTPTAVRMLLCTMPFGVLVLCAEHRP